MSQWSLKRWALCAALALGLSGCVPAALIIGATAGGAVLYDKRTVKGMMHDHKATRRLQLTLSQDPELKKRAKIHVSVYNGIALIVGQVESQELKMRASEDARQIPGIKRIYNELQVTGDIGKIHGVNDAWILSKVKVEMMAKSGLQSSNMSVVVNDGTVYLLGSVSHKQANLAADVARRVAGVKKVVKVFEYE